MSREVRPFVICHCTDHAFATCTKGYVTLVSPDDVHRVDKWNWSSLVSGGRPIPVRNDRSRVPRTRYISREITGATFPLVVDHENGNTMDNRRTNLRLCTYQQNNMNKRVARSGSGLKGICWDNDRKKWRAKLVLDGKQIHLGQYDSEADAAQAYDAGARKHFGDYAATNESLGLLDEK